MKPAKSPSAITPTAPASKNPGVQPLIDLGNVPNTGEALPMPHERDQDVKMTSDETNPVVAQAKKDIERGVKDTSNSPEMDTTYRALKDKPKP